MEPAQLIKIFRQYKFNFFNEKDLQRGIDSVLNENKVVHDREYSLSDKDEIDFLIEGGIGVEVKIKGTLSALTRQLHRYAQNEKIKSLILITDKNRLSNLPDQMNGKELRIVNIGGFAL